MTDENTNAPCLGGRAGVMANAKGEQMFCALTSSANAYEINTDVELTPGWTTPQGFAKTVHSMNDRLWLVAPRGLEVIRFAEELTAPLTRTVITSGPLPAGASRSQNIRAYRVRVKCSDSSGYAVFDMDLNQEIELWAQRIEVTLLGPANALSVPSDVPESLRRQEWIVDSLLGCQIVPIEESKGAREAHLTEYFLNPLSTASTIRVPRSAVGVKVYQGEPIAAAPTIRWNRLLGTTAPINVGSINFNNRVSGDSDSKVGAESHLQTDTDGVSNRLFVVNWTIRP